MFRKIFGAVFVGLASASFAAVLGSTPASAGPNCYDFTQRPAVRIACPVPDYENDCEGVKRRPDCDAPPAPAPAPTQAAPTEGGTSQNRSTGSQNRTSRQDAGAPNARVTAGPTTREDGTVENPTQPPAPVVKPIVIDCTARFFAGFPCV